MVTERLFAYDRLGQVHWWLTGKYVILRDIVKTRLPAEVLRKSWLDIGCGGGAFLKVLFGCSGNCFGTDLSVEVLRMCQGITSRISAADARNLPFANRSFACVSAIDVLEHLDDDAGTLAEVRRVLTPNGWLLLCVPAFPALFGPHDRLFGHLRRYTRSRLCRLLTDGGFRVEKATYIQPMFFPILYGKRKLLPPRDMICGDFWQPPRFLNNALHALLSLERFPLRFMNFPVGATLIVLARK